MSRPVRISIVSYLNSIPFLEGLKSGFTPDEIDIAVDIPSVCVEKMKNGNADIGLIPVAAIQDIENARIFGSHCIACNGVVGSVLVLSHEPIEEIHTVLLDYQSRSSVRLARILFQEKWRKEVRFENASPGYETKIREGTAGVVIGDRALTMAKDFPFVYDLGLAWKELTSLPFVFASWITTTELDPAFLERFDSALENGLLKREGLSEIHQSESIPKDVLLDYWSEKIRYNLGIEERKGMELFLNKIGF